METEQSDSSSEASYFALEPISGAVLLDQELLRYEVSQSRGSIFTGCEELDHHVLLGGLERGWVVGLSAEEETFGLLVRSNPPAAVELYVLTADSSGYRLSLVC
jgi:hypothetical protein